MGIFVTPPGTTNGMILRAQDGALVCLARTDRTVSRDNGRSWQREWSDANDHPECSTAMRMPDGRLMMVLWDPQPDIVKAHQLNGTTYTIALSSDEGKTIDESWPLCDEIGCFYVMNDRLLRLKSGRILLSIAKHPREAFDSGVETAGMVTTAYSDDEGRTWRFGSWIGGNYQEPFAAEASDGTLMLYMRSPRGYLSVSTSADGGETWTEPAFTPLRMTCAPYCVKRDPYSGYLFVVWDESFPAAKYQYPRSPLCMAVSRDDGKTFEKVAVLENNPDANYGYPDMVFDADEIFVSYYENTAARTFSIEQSRVKMQILRRDEMTVEQIITSPLFAEKTE